MSKGKKGRKGFKMVQPDLSHPTPVILKKTASVGSSASTRKGKSGFPLYGPDLSGGGWVK